MYVDKRVLPTQGLHWAIPYVLKLTMIRPETKVVKRGLTEHPGLPAIPSSGPLSDWSAGSANAALLLNRAFECRSGEVVVLAGFGREAVVEKSHITDDQYNYARVTTYNVSRLRNLQSEKTYRIRTNKINPKLSVANVDWSGTLRECE